MSATTWIVRLYPAPLRERWGPDLEGEAGAGGLRRLPDLLIGALDMWAHPVVWPADTPAQRRRRATVLAFVVGLGGWLIGHLAVQELDLPATMTHSWSLDLSDVLLLAGLLLVTPLPRRRTELGRLVRQSARRLALPLLVGGLVLVRANLDAAMSPGLRLVLLTAWWGALVLGAVRVCQVVAGLDPVLAPPHPVRLRLGIGTLATAFAVACAAAVWFTLTDRTAVPAVCLLGGSLTALTLVCGGTLRDLHAVAGAG